MHQLMFFGSPYALATSDLSGIILIGAIVLLVALPMLLRWGLSALIGAGSNAIRDASARNKNKQLEAKGLDTGLLIARYVGSNALPPELADIAEKVARHQISEEEARIHVVTKARSLGLYNASDEDDSWAKSRVTTCSSCGNTVPLGMKFCNKCGSPLPEEAPKQEEVRDAKPDPVQEAASAQEHALDQEDANANALVYSGVSRQEHTLDQEDAYAVNDQARMPQAIASGVACPACGTILPEGTKFCGVCGNSLLQQASPAPVQNSPKRSVLKSVLLGAFIGLALLGTVFGILTVTGVIGGDKPGAIGGAKLGDGSGGTLDKVIYIPVAEKDIADVFPNFYENEYNELTLFDRFYSAMSSRFLDERFVPFPGVDWIRSSAIGESAAVTFNHDGTILDGVERVDFSNSGSFVPPSDRDTATNKQYDEQGNLLSYEYNDPDNYDSYSYTCIYEIDSIGNIVATHINYKDGSTHDVSFGYDDAGNRVSRTTIRRDADGNVTLDETHTWEYSVEDVPSEWVCVLEQFSKGRRV